jgi:hypothetical protein
MEQNQTNEPDPEVNQTVNNPDALPSFGNSTLSSTANFQAANANLETNQNYKKKGGFLKVFIALCVILFLLVGGTITSAALIANGAIKVSNNEIREKASYLVGMIPFMPKTPEYVLLQSAKVHEDISSAYLKASIIINSDEIAKSMPMFANGFDFAIEGPINANAEENPKMMMNFKLTKELDADFGLIDQILYGRLNKIPSFLYPMIGLNEQNIANAPFLRKWISYDTKGLDTDARNAFENRDLEKKASEEIQKQLEAKIKRLTSDKLLPLIKMTSDTLDGKPMYKLSLKMDNNQTQEYYKEFLSIVLENTEDPSYLYLKNSEQTKFKNLEAHIWINKDNYYFTKTDAVFDIEISNFDASEATGVLGVSTFSPTDSVLGVKTANSESKIFEYTMATSISLDRHGEKFDTELTVPKDSIDFETFMLQMSSFMGGSYPAGGNTPDSDGFGSSPYGYREKDFDIEGFE